MKSKKIFQILQLRLVLRFLCVHPLNDRRHVTEHHGVHQCSFEDERERRENGEREWKWNGKWLVVVGNRVNRVKRNYSLIGSKLAENFDLNQMKTKVICLEAALSKTSSR